MKLVLIAGAMFCTLSAFAQDTLRTHTALRIQSPPKIDGLLDEGVWKEAPGTGDFVMLDPVEGPPASQRTEVKILYDNQAVYVGAMLFDTAPDSILKELGTRDADNLNGDKFRFVVDPYNTRQDGYEFGVYVSGVQLDSKFSDETYDAVWQSATKILSNGWSIEMRIPYSAFRFPKKEIQEWAIQYTRDIRRTREFNQWALTPKGKANPLRFFGTLKGISHINPPLRLSLTPYVSAYVENAPVYSSDTSYQYSKSFSYNGGADLKYGIDERFTLDVTLLPDFGQVQSDNKVKNLSYRETTYGENRPFFKEGTELFNRNRLFYSRRIGRTPMYYYDVPYLLNSGEYIVENPSQAKLVNATKLSGRTDNGLGIGIFNAVTNNTFASIKDSATGNTRKFLTEPLTNYNAVVLDQQLKNSSNIYFINTNVIRNSYAATDAAGIKTRTQFDDSNVSGFGYGIINKKSTWQTDGSFVLSQNFKRIDSLPETFENTVGFNYFYGVRKISGRLQFGMGHEVMNHTFNRSDLGYQAINNYSSWSPYIEFNTYKPTKFTKFASKSLQGHISHNFLTKKITNVSFDYKGFYVLHTHHAIFVGGGMSPVSSYDYYEPRTTGRYFRSYEYYYVFAGISSDYRKKIALDMTINRSDFMPGNEHNFPLEAGYNIEFKPRFRASDHLFFIYTLKYYYDPNNIGFANFDTGGDIIFGGRKLDTYENILSVRYMFKNDMSLNLNTRHYWSTGKYIKYYSLLDDGHLITNDSYTTNNDFSYNAFNIDLVYSWQFSPGSLLSIVYKNAIETEEGVIVNNFSDNLSGTFNAPQTNSISLKILYYLDYQYLLKNKQK